MLLRLSEIEEGPTLARTNKEAVSASENERCDLKPLSDVPLAANNNDGDNNETATMQRSGMKRFFNHQKKLVPLGDAQSSSTGGVAAQNSSRRRRRFPSMRIGKLRVGKQRETAFHDPHDTTGELTCKSEGCHATNALNASQTESLRSANKNKESVRSNSNGSLSSGDCEYGHPMNPHIVIHSMPLTKKVVKDVNRHWSRINMANEISDGICCSDSASSVSSGQSSSSPASPKSLSLHHNQCNRDPKALQDLLQSFSKEGKSSGRKKLLRRRTASTMQASNPEPSLKALSLCWNGIGSSAPMVEMVAKRLGALSPNLEELKLCGNPLGIGNNAFESLFRVGLLHQIRDVDLSDCDLGSNSKNGYRALRILAQYLADPSAKIQTLNLKMNGIDSRGAKILAAGISKNTSLKSLQLDCNSIQQDGVNAILDAMIRNPKSALIELSICANLLGSQCVRVIGQKLHQTRLKILRLNHNDMGDDGVELLIPALSIRDGVNKYGGSCLEELHLCSNNLGNKSILALSHTLQSNKFLKKLFLTGNPSITRRSVSTFVDMLQGRNSTLMEVKILEDTYDNHLIHDKLEYLCQTNQFSSAIASGKVPEALWPHMLAKAQRSDVLFFLLQFKPDLFG